VKKLYRKFFNLDPEEKIINTSNKTGRIFQLTVDLVIFL